MQGLDQLSGGLDGLGVAGTIAGGAVAVIGGGVEIGDAVRLVAKDVLLSFLPLYSLAVPLGLAANGIRAALGDEKEPPLLGLILGADRVSTAKAIQRKLPALAAIAAGWPLDENQFGGFYGFFATKLNADAPTEIYDWTTELSIAFSKAGAKGDEHVTALLESPFYMMLLHAAQALWQDYIGRGFEPYGDTLPLPTKKPVKKRRKLFDRLGIPRYSEYQLAAVEASKVKVQSELIASGEAYAPQTYLESAVGGVSTILQGAVSAAGGLLGSSGVPGGSAPALQPSAAPAATLTSTSSSSSTTVLLLVALALVALLVATAR